MSTFKFDLFSCQAPVFNNFLQVKDNLVSNKRDWSNCIIKNNQEILNFAASFF